MSSALDLLRAAGLSIECYIKPEEMELLVQVEGLPDMFLAVRDDAWWAGSGDYEEPDPEAPFILDENAIAKLIAQCVIRKWIGLASDDEGVDYYRSSNATDRHIRPCANFFSKEELVAAIETIESAEDYLSPIRKTLMAVIAARAGW